MKKVIAILLTAAMLTSLTACSSAPASDNGSSSQSSSQSQPQEEPGSGPESAPEESGSESESSSQSASGASEADTVDAGEGEEKIRGGTNQNDAVLVPLDTKMYGRVEDGRMSWYAFTTNSTEGASYKFTTVNKTLDTRPLRVLLYDEDGNELRYFDADSNGRASTVTMKELKPDTVYYLGTVCMNGYKDAIDYMLVIKSLGEQAEGYATTDTLIMAEGTADPQAGEIHPGMNQDDAAMLPLNTRISGTIKDGRTTWFAFRTEAGTEGAYKFTAVNESLDTRPARFYLYDEDGNELQYLSADSNGRASTIEMTSLEPDTVYYIGAVCMNGYQDTINYTLTIKSPEPAETPTATMEKLEEEELVFETPFELNSTQVMFVANQAVFVNEAEAKAALEPVARVILEHPDKPVLLAGTTATDGTQEACVKLSGSRAEAVRDLLVDAFDVPKEQLLTVGLGYEADPFVRGRDRDANGVFIESEGAKNRRVVVLDASDPIAKEILGESE